MSFLVLFNCSFDRNACIAGWAYSLYVLLGIASILYTLFYFRRRNARHYRLQAEKFEREKEREIYRAKIDFFTNVAHEIRTPLTLIKGPLENILMKKEIQPEVEEDLNIMNRNTERLLNLTNQLLDFRKTEVKGFRLNFVERNISALIRETVLRFLPLAKQKEIEFSMDIPEGEFMAHVDQESNRCGAATPMPRSTIWRACWPEAKSRASSPAGW